jgi:uncharacterized protein YggT (Ycf19 family)
MAFVLLALQALSALVLVDAVLSWVMREDQFPRSITTRITDPLYAPIRKLIDPGKTGGFDLSPLIVLLAIQGIRSLLIGM